MKATADGTVIAVTSLSQTNEWDPMCSSWNSRKEQTELLRTPGKAIKLHEKLSSPSRKRNASPTESIERHEEKLAKAQEAMEKACDALNGKEMSNGKTLFVGRAQKKA